MQQKRYAEKQLTQIFKALSHEDRRKLLDLLKNKEMTTGDLVEKFPHLDRCTVMLHLKILEKTGLVISRREGNFRYNSLDIHPFQVIYDRYIGEFAKPASSFLSEFKSRIER